MSAIVQPTLRRNVGAQYINRNHERQIILGRQQNVTVQKLTVIKQLTAQVRQHNFS